MQVSVYFNDNGVVNSVDIYEASLDECLSIIREFDFGENEEEWLYSDNQKIRYRVEDLDTRRSIGRQLLELEEERDEWKEKYKIECQNNDAIKESYDRLTKSFENLLRDRDEWREKYAIECKHNDNLKQAFKNLENSSSDLLKQLEEYKQIASDRDDLKIENDKVKELCDMLQDEKDELQKRFNLVRDDLFQANHQVSELTAEKDKLNMALVGAKSRCATLEQDILFWKGRWESEFEEGVRAKKELEECKQKKSES